MFEVIFPFSSVNVLPVWEADNDSRVPSSQDSSHCMLAMILDHGFKNKMLRIQTQTVSTF